MEYTMDYKEIWIDYHRLDFVSQSEFTDYLKVIEFDKAGFDLWENPKGIVIQAKRDSCRIFKIPTERINKFGIKEKVEYRTDFLFCLDLLVNPKLVIGYDAKKRGTAKKRIFNLMGKGFPEYKEWIKYAVIVDKDGKISN